MKIRIQKLKKLIRHKKMDGLLVSNPYNVRYLTGFVGTNGTLLVTQNRATLITDARYFMTAKKAGIAYFDQRLGVKRLMGKLKVLGFEDRDLTVAKLKAYKKALPEVRFKPASGLVESLRIMKDDEEIKIIKKAVRIACDSLQKLEKLIRPGMSEGDIEWELLRIAHELGADGFSFPPIITFGKDTADIHHQKGPNKLKKGEMVLIDFGIQFMGYITDMTRVFFMGKPKSFEQKIYTTVWAANQEAIKAVKVGAKFSVIDEAARRVIEKAGYGKYFTHSTGHGTGLEVHEAPHVAAKSTEVVKPGMVFTIEPGIYVEGKGGVRIEDMVYVSDKGVVEVLTDYPKNSAVL